MKTELTKSEKEWYFLTLALGGIAAGASIGDRMPGWIIKMLFLVWAITRVILLVRVIGRARKVKRDE